MTPKANANTPASTWQPLNWLAEEKFPVPPKLIILSAAPGSTVAKEQNPNIPITPQEIVENHVKAYKAGAAVVHVHVRDEKGIPTFSLELFKRIILEIRERCPEVIVDCSLAYPQTDDRVEARLEPMFKLGLPFEMGTISAGTFNTRERNFYVNREAYLKEAVKFMQERKVKPVISVYNIRQIEDIKRWSIQSGLDRKPLLNLSLGLFGDPARLDILQSWLRYVPAGCNWIAETAGRNWLPVAVEAIMNGGHVRAGMEDGIYMYPHKDDLIKSSSEAVGKIRRIAEELGREIATPKDAREILGLEK